MGKRATAVLTLAVEYDLAGGFTEARKRAAESRLRDMIIREVGNGGLTGDSADGVRSWNVSVVWVGD